MTQPQHAGKQIRAQLHDAAKKLQRVTQDEAIMAETPVEVQAAIESAAEGITSALRQLEATTEANTKGTVIPGEPTRQQGQSTKARNLQPAPCNHQQPSLGIKSTVRAE